MASTATPPPPPTPMEFPKGVQFTSSIRVEKAPKRAVKTKAWLLKHDFDAPQTERDALFVQNWIKTTYSNSIYCDPSVSTGTSLCEKIRMLLYVENMDRYKEANAARKLANAAATIQKITDYKAAKKRAAQKRRDKEAVQIAKATAAHNGDVDAGYRAWNNKIQKDQIVAKVKRAEEATKDCSKTADFTKWRCGTPQGQCFDHPMTSHHGTYLTHNYNSLPATILRLATKDAFKTFAYLCNQKKTNIHLNVKTHNKTIHQYGIYSIPVTGGTNPRREISALHVEQGATRRPDKDMCGKITKFYHPGGNTLYVNINNKQITLYRLLPKEWRDFGGYKTDTFTAEPKTCVSTSLMFGICDNGVIDSFSWNDNGRRYTAMVQDTGNKSFDDIKNIGTAHYQVAIKKALKAAEKQKAETRRKKNEISNAFRMNTLPCHNSRSTAKRFCGNCGTKINPTTLSGGKAKFCGDCGTRFA